MFKPRLSRICYCSIGEQPPICNTRCALRQTKVCSTIQNKFFVGLRLLGATISIADAVSDVLGSSVTRGKFSKISQEGVGLTGIASQGVEPKPTDSLPTKHDESPRELISSVHEQTQDTSKTFEQCRAASITSAPKCFIACWSR